MLLTTQLSLVVLARHGRRAIFLLAYTPNFNFFGAGVEGSEYIAIISGQGRIKIRDCNALEKGISV